MTRALFLLLGDPVAHSRSPRIHARAFELLGIDAVYAPCRVSPEALPRAFDGLRALGVAGFNVTVPHKEAAARLCTTLSPEAARIGAVNCVSADFTGHNTDVAGIQRALDHALEEADSRAARSRGAPHPNPPDPLPPSGKGGAIQRAPSRAGSTGTGTLSSRAVVVGAGGSARAAAFALPGCAIHNRTRSRAEALARDLGAHVAEPDALRDAALVVHCTTIGLQSDHMPFDVTTLRPDATVIDLVYRGASGETALVKAARARGLRVIDGLAVLVHQAIASLEIWLGRASLRELYAPLREAALA